MESGRRNKKWNPVNWPNMQENVESECQKMLVHRKEFKMVIKSKCQQTVCQHFKKYNTLHEISFLGVVDVHIYFFLGQMEEDARNKSLEEVQQKPASLIGHLKATNPVTNRSG